MDYLMSFVLLLIGFGLLWKGGDFLVEGATYVAKYFNIPEFIIGLTLVAFGTSAPELFVNTMATLSGKSEIVFGNVLGSNIANILLILGVSGLIYPILVKKGSIVREIPFSLGAVAVLFILVSDSWLFGFDKGVSSLGFVDGCIFLGLFILFMYYVFGMNTAQDGLIPDMDFVRSAKKLWVSSGFVFLGLAFLPLGGKLVINSSVTLAASLGVSEAFISLFLVSLGTSLPELVTCAVAATRHKSDIAIGNVVGSNIFNILLILGVSGLVGVNVFNPVFYIDMGIVVAATLLLILYMFTGKRFTIDRKESVVFLLAYSGYLGLLFFRG